MNRLIPLVLTATCLFRVTNAQVGISTDNSAPDNAAILDLKSEAKGFLPPRVSSTQLYEIPSPPEGLTVYNTSVKSLWWYDGTAWIMGKNRDGESCGSVSYGGQTCNAVIVGMQCWMSANLSIGTPILASQNQGTTAQSKNIVKAAILPTAMSMADCNSGMK